MNQAEQAERERPRAARGPLNSADVRAHRRQQHGQPNAQPGRAGERGHRDAPVGRRQPTQRATFARQATQAEEAPFVCGHCGRRVPPLPSGGRHRNHCPYCLYSRHVDARTTGDRASACGALMEPLGTFQRRNGEYALVHRCLGCGFERFNRIAADDDLPLALSLPSLAPRLAEGASMPIARGMGGHTANVAGSSTTPTRTNKPSRRERLLAHPLADRNQTAGSDVEPTGATNVVSVVVDVVADDEL